MKGCEEKLRRDDKARLRIKSWQLSQFMRKVKRQDFKIKCYYPIKMFREMKDQARSQSKKTSQSYLMGHVQEFKLSMLKLNLKTTPVPLKVGAGKLTRV